MKRPLFLMLLVGFSLAFLSGADRPERQKPKKKKEDYVGKAIGRMVWYSGRVQGVGFRATAEEIARDYPVTGWVKNLRDGRVQLLVEGPEDAVTDFLAAIRQHWEKYIEKEQIEEQTVTGKHKEFSITY